MLTTYVTLEIHLVQFVIASICIIVVPTGPNQDWGPFVLSTCPKWEAVPSPQFTIRIDKIDKKGNRDTARWSVLPKLTPVLVKLDHLSVHRK